MTQRSIKEASRCDFTANEMSWEHIRTGALLRIADATEVMTSNYVQLQNDVDYYKRLYRSEQETSKILANSIRSLRGQITLLRRKLSEANAVTDTEK